MRALPLLVALAAIHAVTLAQSNCSAGAGPPTTLATQNPFFGNSLYGHPNYPNAPGPTYTGFCFLFDLTPTVAVDISQIDVDLYDDGNLVQVNSTTTVTSPYQVGATSVVEVCVIPGTPWLGNEANQSAWVVYGTGTLTVAPFHQPSPIVFNTPLTIPAGLWAVSVRIPPTTNGPNPGPLHPMLDPLTTPGVPYVDAAISVVNLQFQREAWTATIAPASHRQNLVWHYTPMSGYANWTSFGTGCVSPNVPVLTLTSRPVVGTTFTLEAANLMAGTNFNVWLFGFIPDPNGFSLGSIGMPGCNLYLQFGSPIISNLSAVVGGVATTQLTIPSDPSYSGVVLYAQSAPMTPGFNIGFFASNAVCIAFGQV